RKPEPVTETHGRKNALTVTPQTAGGDDRDVCTSISPTPAGSSSRRNYADSSYTPRPLPPQTCLSIQIADLVRCSRPVHLPREGSSPLGNSSVAGFRSEIPLA